VFTIGHWQAKIGDPSLVGWFTVVSYYLCAALSLVYVWKVRPGSDGKDLPPDRRFRIFMAAGVFFLGLSKHFNLPGAFTEMGRIVANRIDGYDSRRWPQALLLVVVGIGVSLLIRWSVRHKSFSGIWQRRAPELICLVYLFGLFVLRAVSLHHVGAFLGIEVFGVRLNWIVELSGIYALMVILLMRVFARSDRTDSVG